MKICFKAFDYIGWNESWLNNVNPSFDSYMLFDFYGFGHVIYVRRFWKGMTKEKKEREEAIYNK